MKSKAFHNNHPISVIIDKWDYTRRWILNIPLDLTISSFVAKYSIKEGWDAYGSTYV